MVDIITYDDMDTLFSEDTMVFMEKASAPVKKSYISKMFEGVKALVEKVSRFISDVAAKITGKKVNEVIKKNPKLGGKKVSIKKYNESVKAGNDALAKLKKAKTPGECKRVRDEYDRKRKKILAVTATVTVATIAASAGALALHNRNLKKVAAGLQAHQIAYDSAVAVNTTVAQSVPKEGRSPIDDAQLAVSNMMFYTADRDLKNFKQKNSKAIKEIERRNEKAALRASKKAEKKEVVEVKKPVVTEAHAKAISVKCTPRKARLVIDLVRGKDCEEALEILFNVNHKACAAVSKLIKSAMANATNNFNMNADKLYVASIQASDSVKMKRYLPRAKGSASGLVKRFCNIYVTVKERN